MLEETLVCLAEVVQARLAIGRAAEAVLGAPAVAGKQPLALAALRREAVAFSPSESPLPLAIHHRRDTLLPDIAQAILGEDKMVAAVHIAIVLNHGAVAAHRRHRADTRHLSDPAGQRSIKELHEDASHILPHPLIEYPAGEMRELLRRRRELRQRRVVLCHVGQMAAVRMRQQSLRDGRELDILATVLLVEMIDIQRIVRIKVVDDAHRIPFHAVFAQQLDAAHHFVERGLSRARPPVFIMELLRPVYGDTDEPMVLSEEGTPLIRQQRAISLQAVVNLPPARIAALQCQHLLVETQRTHQRFAAMPREQHLRSRLCLDVLTDEGLQRLIAHEEVAVVSRLGIEMTLLQIVAVVTGEVAEAADRLGHHVQRS